MFDISACHVERKRITTTRQVAHFNPGQRVAVYMSDNPTGITAAATWAHRC